MDGRTTRHEGYAISLSCRWLVEKSFGWLKETGPIRQVKVRGMHKVDWVFVFSCAAKRQERFQPHQLVLAVLGDVVPTLGTAQNRRYRDQKNLFQQMFPVPLHARIAQLGKMLQGVVHLPLLPSSRSMHIASYGHLYASALVG